MQSSGEQRIIEKLMRDMSELTTYLHDEDVNEVMLNSNSQLWIDSTAKGMFFAGFMENARAQSIIYGVAGLMGSVISTKEPLLEVELPNAGGLKGERFTAQLPPVVARPSFTIRKKSTRIYTLADYIATGRLLPSEGKIIKDWIHTRKNIIVAGSPGSGKTTFINALIQEAVASNPCERFILLEDVCELQCAGDNQLSFFTSSTVSMSDLLYTALRSRPDRILVGEVRGPEAHDMLKAWNTGCSGGIGTLHANGTQEAIQRVIDLSMEGGLHHPPLSLIRQTLNAIIFVTRQGSKSGFISDLAEVVGYRDGQFQLHSLKETN
jgi:P-type conjugative transfer ATPase TrbB